MTTAPTPSLSRRTLMPTEEKILDCYRWRPGTCFRCARTGVDTARIGRVRPQAGGEHEVRACRKCVLALEADRRSAAERRGEIYEPGQLGKSDA
ncbi:hypothetical protein [Streptomyces sp. DH37]|uniref:hypothetical protein n=1 Tax=Streptomyces sp. DH37 TaxID=3040122 RepID=UPI002441365E|nr:hypothetical protein [Streptomyces sp. DH37]MDG9701643.1 hypothetical protein [Streptomyces sp. DH37]